MFSPRKEYLNTVTKNYETDRLIEDRYKYLVYVSPNSFCYQSCFTILSIKFFKLFRLFVAYCFQTGGEYYLLIPYAWNTLFNVPFGQSTVTTFALVTKFYISVYQEHNLVASFSGLRVILKSLGFNFDRTKLLRAMNTFLRVKPVLL